MPNPSLKTLLLLFIFAAALPVCAQDKKAEGPFAALLEIGEQTNDVTVLPFYVRSVRELDNGTTVLATVGDPDDRVGKEEDSERYWIPSGGIAKDHHILPEPTLIDSFGTAWYVGNGKEAISTDGLETNVYEAQEHFQGRIAEDQAGRVWISERKGVHHIAQPAKENKDRWLVEREAKWLLTAPEGQVPRIKGRFHAINDQPNGKTVVLPRILYSPFSRVAADPIPGTLHIFDKDVTVKPERAAIEKSGVSQSIPQAAGSWYMIPDTGDGWVWIPKTADLPKELQKLVKDLGSDNYKERQAATKAIKTTFRFWHSRIAGLRKTVEDPEVRMRLDDIMDDWGEAEAMKPDLPLKDVAVNWKQCNYLHTPDSKHAYLVVTVGDKEQNVPNPRYPFCALLRFDATGKYEVLADKIPVTARPGRQLSEIAGGYDLIPLDEGRFLYRDMLARPMLLDDAGRAHQLPSLIMPGTSVLLNTRLLSLKDDTLLMRQRDQVWVVSGLKKRIEKTEAEPVPVPNNFLSARKMQAKLLEIQNLRRTGGDMNAADRVAKEIVASNPHMPDGHKARIFLFYSQRATIGNFLKELDHVIALSPEAADPYSDRGDMWMNARSYNRAIRDYNAALMLQPDNLAYLSQRGTAQMRSGLFDPARSDFERAMKLNPDNAALGLNLVELAIFEDKPEDAVKAATGVIKKVPTFAEAYQQRARAYTIQGKLKSAIADYDKSIELEPDNADYWLGRSNFRIFQRLDVVKAKADIEKSIQLDPENSEALNNLAWMLATYPDEKIRNGKRAVKLAMQASEIRNHTADHILDTLAAAYAEAGDFSKAVHWQEKAVNAAQGSGNEEDYKLHLEAFLLGIPVREPELK